MEKTDSLNNPLYRNVLFNLEKYFNLFFLKHIIFYTKNINILRNSEKQVMLHVEKIHELLQHYLLVLSFINTGIFIISFFTPEQPVQVSNLI